MESDRFEALIDAVVAIVITIIVLEIPQPVDVSLAALWDLRIEFFTYAVSFVVCYNYWNNHQSIFSLVDSVDEKIIWLNAFWMIVLTFLPYLTSFVANNFYSVLAQGLYGLNFIIAYVLFMFMFDALKRANRDNEFLQDILNFNLEAVSSFILLGVGFIVGVMFYPPAIIISCLASIVLWFIQTNILKKSFE